MTVTFAPDSGGGSVSLAGAEDDLADAPLDLEGGAQILVQQDNIVRATKPARFARGNRVVDYTFSVRKTHADYEAAITYWAAHLQAFGELGTVTLTQGSATLTLTACSVIPRGRTLGATSAWTYQVQGVLS